MATAADTASQEKTLYLIDAMALAYRAHYIFISRPLINADGLNTSAAYGFTNQLLKLIEQHEMDHVAVVFDVGGDQENFRNELYAEYKANRDAMPDEIKAMLPYIKRIVEAFDIPVLGVPGVEADDVIGTLAKRASEEGTEVVIVSPDKDFKQLLDEQISIYKPSRRGEEFDPITVESFREEMDLEPKQFIDMLALWGDSSDNVPGVPLIGEKTSAKLLREYGSVEDLIEKADEVGGKRGENLKEYADQARLSKKLVTIRTDCEVDVDWHELRRRKPHAEELVGLFKELEFSSLLDRVQQEGTFFDHDATEEVKEAIEEIGQDGGQGELAFDFGQNKRTSELDESKVDYAIVSDREALVELVGELEQLDAFAVDTETTSSDAMWASLVGISFSWEAGAARYVPSPLPDGTSESDLLDLLRPALEGEALKVGQNIKYDMMVLSRHGVELGGPLFDTMVAHYLAKPEEQHNLDAIARTFLGYTMMPITDLIGKGKEQISMRDVPVAQVVPYACEDADIAWQLRDLLTEALEKVDLLEVAETMEFPLVRVLAEMELRGIRVDTDRLDEISEELGGRMDELEKQIFELAGEEFNINSPQQLGEILFEKLELPVKAKTSTGKPSTKESVLQDLSSEHELPALVLDWRSLAKLKGTYVDALGELIHPETVRIHTSFNQTVTSTGRLSSSDPNLQNIPVRTATGREIRKAFVPEPDWLLLAADYEQIELRILASMSGDEALKAVFEEEQDIHTATAARIYDIDPSEVERDQRRKAKEVNYGIPYGVSPWGLARRLRTSVGEAQELISQYQRSYPGVSTFLNQQVEQARSRGYVETLLGRRRYLPEINSRNRNRRGYAERAAVNMPIQGTQADMIKIAMVRLYDRLREEGLEARVLLQVHDELVLEMPPEEEEIVRRLVEEEMVGALELNVPVVVDMDAGDNWLAAH